MGRTISLQRITSDLELRQLAEYSFLVIPTTGTLNNVKYLLIIPFSLASITQGIRKSLLLFLQVRLLVADLAPTYKLRIYQLTLSCVESLPMASA
jgi:hypothetical protein